MNNLKAKLFIKGKIKILTGLHIGGSSTALDIGGIDSNIIKTSAGVPFIPGSSLKGKMRALYGISKGYSDIKNDDKEMKKVFGEGATEHSERTRLIVRDSFLDIVDFNSRKNSDFSELELQYTEGKWENTINRVDSTANPRQLERIPAGAIFDFEFVYSIFNEQDVENLNILLTSMRLLQDDYLGGSGSRGYGKIEFSCFEKTKFKTTNEYEKENIAIETKNLINLKSNNQELFKELKEVIK